jgi:hypothetical protein
MENQTTIIEINGVKLEVDLRHARKIENYKVGDHIKVLVKDYEDFKSYIGTIIGFDEFEKTPTIVIAYLKTGYGSATIEFVYYNSKKKDVEICQLNDWDLPVSKQQVLDRFDAEMERKRTELSEMEQKKTMFLKLFGKYFENEFASTGVNLD